MSWNPFKALRERRAQKAALKRLGDIASVFGNLEKTEKGGLLTWDERDRRLFIAAPLATVMMGKGQQAWEAFLQNCYLWQIYREQQKAYEKLIRQEQAKAIRTRQMGGIKLPQTEIARIKRAITERVLNNYSYENRIPEIKAFEFYILADSANDPKRQQVVLVGQYHPETGQLSMATWEDVQTAVQQQQEQQA